MDSSTFEPRFITNVLYEEARIRPDRTFCIQSLSLDSVNGGWRRVTVADLARAVDAFASWIEERIAPNGTPTRLAYVGSNDARYNICVLACLKLGHCVSILRPGKLLRSGDCSNLLFISKYRETAQEIQKSQENLQLCEVQEISKWFDGPETSSTPDYYCRERASAQTRDAKVILYSSGTTGLPKAIPLPHGYFIALDYLQHVPVPPGRVSTAPWLSNPEHPHILKTKLFHGSALSTWAAAILHGTHFVLGPDVPLTAPLLKQIVAQTKAKTGLFVPDELTFLSSSAEGLEALASLDCVSFVGVAMPTSVGNKISKLTRLQSSIGITEAGFFYSLRPVKREDWEYFEWNPDHPMEMRPYHDKCFQLVIPRPPGRYTHCVFLDFPHLQEFCTGDLYIQHPENPALWKNVGRCDDMLKLQNSVLLLPHPIESSLAGHDLVSRALVTTDHALLVVLIIEPWSANQLLPGDVLDGIWPSIQKINEDLPREAQIAKDHVLIAPAGRPFQTTPKGSMRRRSVVQTYSDDIKGIPASGSA
ncbi:acetyl-CoA synthetase-like protein [Aspergillus aurantiobrunneus]